MAAAINGNKKQGIAFAQFGDLQVMAEGKGRHNPFSPLKPEHLGSNSPAFVFPNQLKFGNTPLVVQGSEANAQKICQLKKFFSPNTTLMLVPENERGLIDDVKTLIPRKEREEIYAITKELFLEFYKSKINSDPKVRTTTFQGDKLDQTAMGHIEVLKSTMTAVYEDIIYPSISKSTGARDILLEDKIVYSGEVSGSLEESLKIDMVTRNHVNIGLSFLSLLTAYNEHVLKKQKGAKPYTMERDRDKTPWYLSDEQVLSAALGAFLYNLGYFHKEVVDFRNEVFSEIPIKDSRLRELRAMITDKTLEMFGKNLLLKDEIKAKLVIKSLRENGKTEFIYGKLFKIAKNYHELVSETVSRPFAYSRTSAIDHLIKNAGTKYDRKGVEIFLKDVVQPYAPGEIVNVYSEERNDPLAQARVVEYENQQSANLIDCTLPKICIISVFYENGHGMNEGDEISLVEKHKQQPFEIGDPVQVNTKTGIPMLEAKFIANDNGNIRFKVEFAFHKTLQKLVGGEHTRDLSQFDARHLGVKGIHIGETTPFEYGSIRR